IKRAQRETFWGLSLGSNPELSPASEGDFGGEQIGFLSNEIHHDPALGNTDRPLSQHEPVQTADFWSFSDADDAPTENSRQEDDND
ncbi:MAG: hypothetical protein KAI82_01205, partial [Tritonibacter mobilis]|nr:hypothetical protein [Tritonibacter mobilis]